MLSLIVGRCCGGGGGGGFCRPFDNHCFVCFSVVRETLNVSIVADLFFEAKKQTFIVNN